MALDCPHLDADAFYWKSAAIPFTRRRPPAERRTLLRTAQADAGWVLSGSVVGWGEEVLDDVHLIVFLTADTATRLTRLRYRESKLHGARIAEGGDMYHIHQAFLERTRSYDLPDLGKPCRVSHELWLDGQTAPVLRLDGTLPPDELARVTLSRAAQLTGEKDAAQLSHPGQIASPPGR
ncbi:adenylate kinase [Palleronia aestuarii]|nr:adenylate kinase [Palleronia aestuarii]